MRATNRNRAIPFFFPSKPMKPTYHPECIFEANSRGIYAHKVNLVAFDKALLQKPRRFQIIIYKMDMVPLILQYGN